MSNQLYVVFRRSCRNWEEFGSANKFVVRKGLTIEEARQMCSNFNDNRTSAQIKRGTKYEFTTENSL